MDDQDRNVALIIKNLRIRRLDDKNLVLERFMIPTKENRQRDWSVYGYYRNFDDLVDVLLRLLVSIPPTSDLATQITLLNKNIIQTKEDILEAIKPVSNAWAGSQGQIEKESK